MGSRLNLEVDAVAEYVERVLVASPRWHGPSTVIRGRWKHPHDSTVDDPGSPSHEGREFDVVFGDRLRLDSANEALAGAAALTMGAVLQGEG